MQLNQNYTSFDQLAMPYLRLIIGLMFILLSLYATISFLTQGFDGLTFLTIVLFCIGIEAVKVLFAGDFGFYLALKMPEKALFSFLIVTVLFCLSIGAETWFLMNGNLKEQAALETAGSRTASLQSQIDSKRSQLSKCPSGYVTRCIAPLNSEIDMLQNELTKSQQAEANESSAIANRKFWQQIANATGTTVDNLQLGLSLLRSALAEIIGLFLLGQFAAFKRLQNMPKNAFEGVYSHEKQAGNGHVPSDNAAEVFALMSAKIEALEKQLEKKQ